MAFVPDSDQLSDVGVGRSYLVAQKLKQGTDVEVVVRRRPADPGGSAARGQKLDLLRTDAVKRQLESFGVAAVRMSTVGPARPRPALAAKAGWTCPVSQGLEFEIDAATEQGTESMNARGGGSGL